MKLAYRLENQSGFSLIEVLVALLILMVGLLGVAGMQATSLSNSSQSAMRSQAVLYAYDMADRMRANRDVATDLSTAHYQIGFGDVPASDLPGLVKSDLDGWLASLATLPGGQGAIELTSSGAQVRARIRVSWAAKSEQKNIQMDTLL